MSAECAGLVFGITMGLQNKYQNTQISNFLSYILGLFISYIYLTNCRSAYIGIFLVIALFFFTKQISISCLAKILLISLIVSICVILLQSHLKNAELGISSHNILSGYAFQKTTSTHQRWILFKQTIEMIKDHPLGIGIGQYELKSIPYLQELVPFLNETIVYRSPHIEILRFAVEDGLLVFSLFSFLFFSFLIKNIQKILLCLKENPEISGFFTFFFVQFIFQFPLDNPFPLSLTAFMLAYFFAKLKLQTFSLNLKATRAITSCLFAFILYGTITRGFSEYVGHAYPENIRLNSLACTFDPSNWSACLNVVTSQMNQNNFDKALESVRFELEKRPLLFPAIKYMAILHLNKGNIKMACLYAKKYDKLFNNQSSLNALRAQHCR